MAWESEAGFSGRARATRGWIPGHVRTRIGRIRTAGLVSSVLIWVLVSLSGSAGSIAPPFRGAVLPYSSTTVYGCAKGTIVTPGLFKFNSGHAGFDAQARSTWCVYTLSGLASSAVVTDGSEAELRMPFLPRCDDRLRQPELRAVRDALGEKRYLRVGGELDGRRL